MRFALGGLRGAALLQQAFASAPWRRRNPWRRPGPARRVDAGRAAERSTSRPELSARAGKPEVLAAATAFIRGVGREARRRSPRARAGRVRRPTPRRCRTAPRARAISRTLPGLWVAITSWPVIRRCMRSVYRVGALLQSRHGQLLQIAPARRCPCGRAPSARSNCSWLNGVVSAVPCTSTMPPDAGHDEIGVGVGLGILGIIEVEHRPRRHRARTTPRRRGRAARRS